MFTLKDKLLAQKLIEIIFNNAITNAFDLLFNPQPYPLNYKEALKKYNEKSPPFLRYKI